ncbi:hypothetical protein CHM34_17325 [Paludifilum halophilum]|uniref:Uncharacterized protein n=1 Tax=Paludifilum halophilum TaxID=1642702 RepID=A0A235B1X1_9BACL|nr:hypothetical protein CHM34_17325 [Paludifilum halophilum]
MYPVIQVVPYKQGGLVWSKEILCVFTRDRKWSHRPSPIDRNKLKNYTNACYRDLWQRRKILFE